MPLFILGLILIIGISIYWFVGNSNSDEPIDPRDIGEKFSSAAQDRANEVRDDLARKIRKRAGIFDVDYDIEDDGYGGKGSGDSADSEAGRDPDDNTIPFPKNVEREKRKRDIH